MLAVAVLLPGLVLGAVAWGVLGVLRQRGREELTLATAAAFYARVMVVAGILAVVTGAGVLVKLGLSLIDPAYSYTVPSAVTGYPSPHDQQLQDVIVAGMLCGVGGLVAGGHALIARFAGQLPGGSPEWVVRGTLVALTVFTGLAAFGSTLLAGFQVLSYFIVGAQTNGPFGDAAGAALVFVPAWAVVTTLLLRRLRPQTSRPGAAMASA